MMPDPEPDDILCILDSQGAIMQANADGPETAGLLELEGWMLRVGLQQ